MFHFPLVYRLNYMVNWVISLSLRIIQRGIARRNSISSYPCPYLPRMRQPLHNLIWRMASDLILRHQNMMFFVTTLQTKSTTCLNQCTYVQMFKAYIMGGRARNKNIARYLLATSTTVAVRMQVWMIQVQGWSHFGIGTHVLSVVPLFVVNQSEVGIRKMWWRRTWGKDVREESEYKCNASWGTPMVPLLVVKAGGGW